jgi:hypothetical protein
MTPARQIEANRANASSRTGPTTDQGKQRASQNAIRHGLTAETVILPLEDPDDYMAFEQAVTADYEAETAVERELVLRLASLLWRLRRATSVESGLLQIREEFLPKPSRAAQSKVSRLRGVSTIFRQPIGDQSDDTNKTSSTTSDVGRDLARRFMRLADLDNDVFERLGRYEASLWRQVRQTLFTLEGLRWRTSRARTWRTQRTMVSEADW